MIDQALAAWQPATGRSLEIGPIGVLQPGLGEILVRSRAVAINPVDWILKIRFREECRFDSDRPHHRLILDIGRYSAGNANSRSGSTEISARSGGDDRCSPSSS